MAKKAKAEFRDPAFETKLIIPQIVDFDRRRIVVEADGKITINYRDDRNTLGVLQGIFFSGKGWILCQNLAYKDKYGGIDLSAKAISRGQWKPIGSYSLDCSCHNTYGHIYHRQTEKEFKRMGIASYAFQKLEAHLKESGIEACLIGSDLTKPKELKNFLKNMGYLQRRPPEELDCKLEFVKDLSNLNVDETFGVSEFLRFPVLENELEKDFVMKISQLL